MSEWTTEPPKADGAYWLSITPEKRPSPSGRNDFPPVVKCYIQTYRANALYIGSPAGPLVKYDRGGDWLSLDQDWFNGAQWKLVDPDPVDPFAEPPQVALSPEAERIWKSLSPATEVRGDDARRLLESLVDVASPDEIARRRAVSRERLAQNDKRPSSSRDNDFP